MTASNSTPSPKPIKPYPAFPLFAHAAGVWAKKIRGELHYFGPWADPDCAPREVHGGEGPRAFRHEATTKSDIRGDEGSGERFSYPQAGAAKSPANCRRGPGRSTRRRAFS